MSATSAVWLAAVAVAAGLVSGYGAHGLVHRSDSTAAPWRTAALLAAPLAITGAVSWRFDDRPWLYPAYLLLAGIAVPLAAVDVAEHRIPNVIVRPALLLTPALLGIDAAHAHQASSILRAVLAALAVYAVALVLILACDEAMGWGDGRLLALSALFLGYLGWGRLFQGLLIAFASAALAAGGLLLSGRRGTRLPLAPYLLFGTLVAVLATR